MLTVIAAAIICNAQQLLPTFTRKEKLHTKRTTTPMLLNDTEKQRNKGK